jgi:hypothetical protein
MIIKTVFACPFHSLDFAPQPSPPLAHLPYSGFFADLTAGPTNRKDTEWAVEVHGEFRDAR